MNRRTFLGSALYAGTNWAQTAAPPNILLITVDDMNWDTPGCFGGTVPGITPNIDRLATQGMRFEHAHVTIAVCQPCRSVLMTGRYPHRNGAEGFHPIRKEVPTLQESLRQRGYLNGILAKTPHLTPKEKFCWDMEVPAEQLGRGRNPQAYGRHTAEFLARAKAEGKPFFLMANAEDPHRPYAGSDNERDQPSVVRRTISASEAVVPKFLPDLPEVRRELAQYYTSAFRADETVGQVLEALRTSGLEQNTLVMFLSDNGVSLPWAKTNCYLNSTRTPWIVRWPGKVQSGSVNRTQFISGIDFMPTILEAAGCPPVAGIDGQSFLPVLRGKTQKGRDHVFTVFHETSARRRFETRAVQTAEYLYIYNDWVDGKTIFQNEAQSGLTWKAMQAAAKADAALAARVHFYSYRVVEELYDLRRDPNALQNLAAQKQQKSALEKMRQRMQDWMQAKQDPLAERYSRVRNGVAGKPAAL